MVAKKDIFQIKGRSTVRTAGNKVYVRPKPVSSSHLAKPAFPEKKPVQGQMPDSKEEYWCALALYRLKLDFVFQKRVMGGRSGRGKSRPLSRSIPPPEFSAAFHADR